MMHLEFMNTETKSHAETLAVGQKVSYLDKLWVITQKEMPASLSESRFLILERINATGSHERIPVGGQAWELVRNENP